MATRNTAQSLYYFKKPTRWTNGIGAELPEAYKKFWREWKIQQPVAVHYVEKKGSFERDELTGEVKPIQNVPLPLKYPKEINDGIWGGEAVVQGFTKKTKWRRRLPHFWVPHLIRSVVYSEVLNTYMRVTVTKRTLHLINENYGFDHYLLKTPACDLRSELALSLKRKILIALADKTLYPDDSKKKEEIYNKYQQYLQPYTREEIEWYGLPWKTACLKWIDLKTSTVKIEPLKLKFRSELIAKLKEANIAETQNVDMPESESKTAWISKLNPFAKTPKAE